MKVLLLGEFSGLYSNLKHGLLSNECSVLHVSAGDTWKAIKSDIDLSFGCTGKFGFYIAALYSPIIFKSINLDMFDVIQIIHPNVFSPLMRPFFEKIFAGYKGKLFVSVAGNDFLTYTHVKKNMQYHWFDGDLEDSNGKTPHYLRKRSILWNEKIVEKATGFIPVCYEYSLGYRNLGKPCEIIPLSISTEKIKFSENKVNGKIVFLHGINKRGFKGTAYILEALERLRNNYPNDVNILMPERLSLSEYETVLRQSNVVIDQCNSYSYGMNAIISMAMGKVVMSGSEAEAISALGVSDCPVINIKPSVDDIYIKLKKVLEEKHTIPELSCKSIEYVITNHNSVTIGKKYMNFWQANFANAIN